MARSNTRIDNIIQLLSAGGSIAISNTFKVSFEMSDKGSGAVLLPRLQKILPGFDAKHLKGDQAEINPASIISLMCDEADLPGVQAATGQINGIYTGSGQYQYAHTRIYNDLTLSWICDANMTPLKFLQVWMETIFNEYEDAREDEPLTAYNQGSPRDIKTRQRNRSVRLSYPDEYTVKLNILKAEKNNSSETGRPSIAYKFDGVYPYSIDTIPLSFGTSQLVKVSANFYYERWYPYYVDTWNKKNISTYNESV